MPLEPVFLLLLFCLLPFLCTPATLLPAVGNWLCSSGEVSSDHQSLLCPWFGELKSTWEFRSSQGSLD